VSFEIAHAGDIIATTRRDGSYALRAAPGRYHACAAAV
jgi:hypothetical protein